LGVVAAKDYARHRRASSTMRNPVVLDSLYAAIALVEISIVAAIAVLAIRPFFTGKRFMLYTPQKDLIIRKHHVDLL